MEDVCFPHSCTGFLGQRVKELWAMLFYLAADLSVSFIGGGYGGWDVVNDDLANLEICLEAGS